MKLNLKSVTSFFSHTFGGPPRPQRDWFLILIVAIVLAIGSIAMNTALFFSAQNGEALPNAPASTQAAQAPSTAPFDTVTALFTARAATAADYEARTRISDPSL